MIKNYLLDTNILLQNPQSLFGFEDNNVYLCGTTMQELDGKKTAPGELGYNARECCRILDGLRETGDLTKGVVLHTTAEPKKCRDFAFKKKSPILPIIYETKRGIKIRNKNYSFFMYKQSKRTPFRV